MKVEFVSNLNRRYMTISDKDGSVVETGYVTRMILENQMEDILPASRAGIDGTEMLRYDITGKVSVSACLKAGMADPEFFISFFRALAGVQERVQQFLIRREAVMVLPDQIFYDPEEKKFCFGIWPSGNVTDSRQWQKLAEILISGLPSGDQNSAQMVYRFYQACISGEATAEEIRKITGSTGWYEQPEEKGVPTEFPENDFFDTSFPVLEEPKKKGRDKKNSKAGSEDKKVPAGKGLFERFIQSLTRDRFGKKAKKKKEDERNEEFFRLLFEKEKTDSRKPEAEALGTVLLSGSGSGTITETFVLESKSQRGRNFQIFKEDMTVGREKGKCDIILNEPTVSRVHARLIRNRESIDLIDIGSKNGTKVNGRMLPKEVPFSLSDGDEVVFGKAKYVFRIHSG